MKWLLRLDLERVRRNLGATTRGTRTEDDVLRLLAELKVWRKSDEWFVADDPVMRTFLDGDVLEKRPAD